MRSQEEFLSHKNPIPSKKRFQRRMKKTRKRKRKRKRIAGVLRKNHLKEQQVIFPLYRNRNKISHIELNNEIFKAHEINERRQEDKSTMSMCAHRISSRSFFNGALFREKCMAAKEPNEGGSDPSSGEETLSTSSRRE
jgi:hypothetical protein